MGGSGIYRFPYRDLSRLTALTIGYWPELAGRYIGSTGQRLATAEVSDALCFVYWHFIDVDEFRDEARKSLESLLTLDIDELRTAPVDDKRPVNEIAADMTSEWDDFEAALGLTRSTEPVE